jgi:hypothetical protein
VSKGIIQKIFSKYGMSEDTPLIRELIAEFKKEIPTYGNDISRIKIYKILIGDANE